MKTADGCSVKFVEFTDSAMLSITYGGENEFNESYPERCHDCNCRVGHLHHPGCDVERCPKCGGQVISCGCAEEIDDEEDEENDDFEWKSESDECWDV